MLLPEYLSSSLSEGKDMENLSVPCFVNTVFPVRGRHGKPSVFLSTWDLFSLVLSNPTPSPALNTSHHHCQRAGESPPSSLKIPPGTYPLWSLHQTRLLPAFVTNTSHHHYQRAWKALLCGEYLSSSLSEGHGKLLRLPEILPGTYPLWSLHQTRLLPCFVRIPLIITVRGAWKALRLPEILPGTYPLWSLHQTRLLPALCEYLSSSLSEGMESPLVPDPTHLLPALCEYLIITVGLLPGIHLGLSSLIT
ncbi:unnamed protein product [Acanthosepion pharaonis]|uniref:Uncharacterized protein n=1 Tax=Acanthosepion pharaonis TaxID=158019 RepID=A0A812CGW4_ACAPH|nr:unnamed protein product [Sepia pharaonis]